MQLGSRYNLGVSEGGAPFRWGVEDEEEDVSLTLV